MDITIELCEIHKKLQAVAHELTGEIEDILEADHDLLRLINEAEALVQAAWNHAHDHGRNKED